MLCLIDGDADHRQQLKNSRRTSKVKVKHITQITSRLRVRPTAHASLQPRDCIQLNSPPLCDEFPKCSCPKTERSHPRSIDDVAATLLGFPRLTQTHKGPFRTKVSPLSVHAKRTTSGFDHNLMYFTTASCQCHNQQSGGYIVAKYYDN